MRIIISFLIIAASWTNLYLNLDAFNAVTAFLSVINFILVFSGKKDGMRTSPEMENLVEKLNDRSLRDNLTGAYNRLAFNKHLNEVYKRFKLFNEPFFVLFFDIDYFKKFNDTYGHETGDNVLKEFAGVIMKHTRRDKDLFFRYGGEEFVMVTVKPNVPPREDAGFIIKNLRRAISEINIPGTPKITCSIGAGFPDKDKEKEYAVRQADENVYRAKKNGRNRAYLDKEVVII